ncbi:MAG: hypothetical protein A2W52_03110 [Candidatus Taylorbacteria bacterium RIFCSPHIGHO2_02_49_25]|uniref:Uncharacterized protein n=1 Tax=Candidatus Taylorbacteria bacterium RIFCSPHIGHO2_02_49_25 TaxID=1802305 RepID=A0A1G2MG30_9BACT|nr:MAG: hypothetical protein A2759_04265 [Candidatus Taylorbacteria bacterium RIFCSPHIGHO2_01_FULL_49_60]OHA22875.1 MAG: hypothetical protein A2W52_03110 [Candidatus Taylorbacteria bacterium RIFCSPHIGHO2_02_49_25]OHA36309.1 MAG: hypothetical protein A2W65_01450 [Candidatus Taylorbacteria bacterium RIFCSPLOWO2_02_50_13]OHA41008.1 MAG: hypothetical protein A3H73_02640 [Candidatus Taylorbacteria bacterium RIFCSPLOWO2_02_FULL_50_120]OHA46862.1 MAG: hypothetical protein A3G61_00790 [Candidatus Taylo
MGENDKSRRSFWATAFIMKTSIQCYHNLKQKVLFQYQKLNFRRKWGGGGNGVSHHFDPTGVLSLQEQYRFPIFLR